MAKAYKLPLRDLLTALDQRNPGWLSQQSEAARKEFSPLLAMRWAASLKNNSDIAAAMLWTINERVNRYLYVLSGKHPDLVFRLLASCGRQCSMQREYLASKQASQSNKAFDLLCQHYPLANQREIEVVLSQFTRQTFGDFLADCGKEPKEITEIMKAYDALQ